LTFGRIIALAGDFYTNPDRTPICGAFYNHPNENSETRFLSMVDSLEEDRDLHVQKVCDVLDKEVKAAKAAMDPLRSPQ
jgi:hypothetical protein